MSVYPKKVIKKYLGLIDVHIVRHIYKLKQDDQVQKIIEQVLEEVNEIVKSRVEALGGNCLLGYKIDINTIEQNFQTQLYLMISCFGDAVEVCNEESEKEAELLRNLSASFTAF